MAWEKGKSANPGGRPKAIKELQELAREHTREAVNRLLQLMRQGKDLPTARASAALILERGWGKPVSSVEHTGKDGGPIETQITDSEAARLIAFTLSKATQEKVSTRTSTSQPAVAITPTETTPTLN